MSPYLSSADAAHTSEGERVRRTTTVAEASVLSISDLFDEYAKARQDGNEVLMRRLRKGADAELAAELDGLYPAAA